MSRPTLRPPRRVSRLVERVTAKDREWFETHPGAHSRIREYVPGEDWPAQGKHRFVLVQQIAPGIRLRRYFGAPSHSPDDVLFLFNLETGEVLGSYSDGDRAGGQYGY